MQHQPSIRPAVEHLDGNEDVLVIRATCPSCGDVPAHEVIARVCRTDQTAAFRFRCSTCSMVALKPTALANVATLAENGVEVEEWDRPIFDPQFGRAITEADVKGFALCIENDHELQRQMVLIGGRPLSRWQALRRRFAARA